MEVIWQPESVGEKECIASIGPRVVVVVLMMMMVYICLSKRTPLLMPDWL